MKKYAEIKLYTHTTKINILNIYKCYFEYIRG